MRPMKCESLMDREGVLHLDKVVFPKLVSPKFDGNRCYIEGGEAKSSTGKPVQNHHIREILSDSRLNGLDGEIIVEDPCAKDVRRKTSSSVARRDGQPGFTFFVFDNFIRPYGFAERTRYASWVCDGVKDLGVVWYVEHKLVTNRQELLAFEDWALTSGYEGVILRDPNAPYKQGRATLKQNWALKLKRFVDAEAAIIGSYERMHNDNEATKNEHGYTERSSHKDNKRSAGDLGGLEVRDIKTGVEFCVGTGFSGDERARLWERRASILGKIITYKHFPVGAKDKPNLPSFVAFRDEDDM